MELASRQRAKQCPSCRRDRPVVTRVYQNHSLDSTRWNVFTPRPGDIVVASAYKAGTTWIQQIVLSLLNPGDASQALLKRSPWLEAPITPMEDVRAGLDAETSRRRAAVAIAGQPRAPGPCAAHRAAGPLPPVAGLSIRGASRLVLECS